MWSNKEKGRGEMKSFETLGDEMTESKNVMNFSW